MINVRRSDGRTLDWILEHERAEGHAPEPGYCTDARCPDWAAGGLESNGIRWCDSFWQHTHVEDWTDTGSEMVPQGT